MPAQRACGHTRNSSGPTESMSRRMRSSATALATRSRFRHRFLQSAAPPPGRGSPQPQGALSRSGARPVARKARTPTEHIGNTAAPGVQRPRPPQKVRAGQLRPRPEPPPPITDRLTRHPEPLPSPPIPLPAHRQQRRADHHPDIPPTRQTRIRQQHVRRPARPFPTPTTTRPHPPHPKPVRTSRNREQPRAPTPQPDNADTTSGRQRDPPRPQHDRLRR